MNPSNMILCRFCNGAGGRVYGGENRALLLATLRASEALSKIAGLVSHEESSDEASRSDFRFWKDEIFQKLDAIERLFFHPREAIAAK